MNTPKDEMDFFNQYRTDIDSRLTLAAEKKAQLTASLQGRDGQDILIDSPSAESDSDIASRPYFAPPDDDRNRQVPNHRRLLRWGTQAAAVLLVVALAVMLLPKRPALSNEGTDASEGEYSADWDLSDVTDDTEDTGTTTAGPSGSDEEPYFTSPASSTTTMIRTTTTASQYRKYTSGPLAILCTPGTFGGGNWFTEEQVRAIFGAITSLSDEMDILYEHVTVSQGFNEFCFADMSHSAGKVFVIAECFDTGVRELRLCNTTGGEYEVLDSKPLPDGYDRLTLYDRYMRYACPSMCITQADLDAILNKGFLAPLIEGKNAKFSSNGTYFSDDKMVLGFNFYMPSIQSHVFINENYRTRQMQYTISQIPNLKLLEDGPYTGTVPLSDKADRYAYAAASHILNG